MLLEGRFMRPALYNTREHVLLWCCVRGARVELHRNARTPPVFGLAMPPAHVGGRAGRSTWSCPPPGELVGDRRSAALSLVPSTRQHLRLVATTSRSGLRAAARCTGTRSMRYFKAGCSRVAERGTGSHAALAGFSPTFSWGVTMKCHATSHSCNEPITSSGLNFGGVRR